ncbi:MAG: hypothetical protein KBF42_09285 [Chitinophagales bacterium]|nr:hypothetical protein [Bacteroidota bacterium]MBK7569085.1 hypothetical protein [Bacteroidota bacterium]MBP8917324.1 hypothetical protein [Chitinophagales bacterium]MBP9221567.1 hypothetical protein [Chitinophagales bacterium]MBP9797026.1 hypothetical protein [Chitinophagales bacterium]
MRVKILLLFICISSSAVYGQNAPAYHPIDRSEWEKATEGLSYNEKKQEEEKPKEVKERDFSFNLPISQQLAQVIGFILIAALLVFILLKLFGKGLFGNKKVDVVQKTTLHELDERPMETDLERFLREALENRDFRLAIRIYYLMLLKILHDKNFIEWKKNKTNMDYLAEVSKHPSYPRLSNNTIMYEFIWYGEKTLGESQFNLIRTSYIDLLKELKNGN